MAYRATVHNSTGFSPSRLFLGREYHLPVDLVMGLPVSEMNGEVTMDEYVERQQQLAEETFQLVREHLSRNAQRRKSAYDAKVRERELMLLVKPFGTTIPENTQRSHRSGRDVTFRHTCTATGELCDPAFVES